VLSPFNLEGMAAACRAAFFEINSNVDMDRVIPKALDIAAGGKPVIVDVNIDYSKRTRFTRGVVKTVLKQFSGADKTRFIGRALIRKITG
jgi:acetolactate synthase-1/2/3 large subunit